MAKYIKRTIETYNTEVVFVMDGQINTYELSGLVGKKKAKLELKNMFGVESDIVIVSVNKKLVNSKMYRITMEKFLEYADEVNAIPTEE